MSSPFKFALIIITFSIIVADKLKLSVGCNPLPSDDNHYWNVSYPKDALTTGLSDPPLREGDDVVKLACRSG